MPSTHQKSGYSVHQKSSYSVHRKSRNVNQNIKWNRGLIFGGIAIVMHFLSLGLCMSYISIYENAKILNKPRKLKIIRVCVILLAVITGIMQSLLTGPNLQHKNTLHKNIFIFMWFAHWLCAAIMFYSMRTPYIYFWMILNVLAIFEMSYIYWVYRYAPIGKINN